MRRELHQMSDRSKESFRCRRESQTGLTSARYLSPCGFVSEKSGLKGKGRGRRALRVATMNENDDGRVGENAALPASASSVTTRGRDRSVQESSCAQLSRCGKAAERRSTSRVEQGEGSAENTKILSQ